MDNGEVSPGVVPRSERKQSIRKTDWAQTPVLSNLDTNILIRQSSVQGAGLGLFVRTGFVNGQLITLYSGPLVTVARAHALLEVGQASHLRSLFCADQSIDGIRVPQHGLGGGSFINHPEDNQQGNASFVPFLGQVYIRATRTILPGEEIFIPYGAAYRHQRPLVLQVNLRLIWFQLQDGRCLCTPDRDLLVTTIRGAVEPWTDRATPTMCAFAQAYRGLVRHDPTEAQYRTIRPHIIRYQSDNVEVLIFRGLDLDPTELQAHVQAQDVSALVDLGSTGPRRNSYHC